MKATQPGNSAEQPIEVPCEQAVNEAVAPAVSGRSLSRRVILGLGAVAAAMGKPGQVLAQEKVEESKDYKAKLDIKIDTQKTPDIQGFGVKPKPGKPRDWLELELQLDIDASAEAKKKSGKIVPAVQVKYFLYFNAPVKEQRRILTADITYTDVPVGDKVYTIVFVHPNTIFKLTGNYNVTVGSASMYGVEVTVDGKLIGFKSSGQPFWKSATADTPPFEPSMLPKSKTPFSSFWGDRHLQERTNP